MTRLYHVDAVSEKTGRRTRMTAYPVPHREALTIRGNLMNRPDVRRLVLVEAPATGSARPFFRTTFEVVVLSQESVSSDALRNEVDDLIQGFTTLPCFAYMKEGKEDELTGPEMAKALTDMVGSPEEFGLTADGHDIPDHPELTDS